MLVRLIVIVCMCAGVMLLPGCKLTNTPTPEVTSSAVDNNGVNNKNSQPSPQPRAKSAPIYPPAEHVIAWHANQCGGFKSHVSSNSYMGERQLKSFFRFMCDNISSEPKAVMNKLLKIDTMYFWPDDIKQYLWLQKHSIRLQINAKQAQQALSDKMQQTLSSLAAIEQQLLLREETKEQ